MKRRETPKGLGPAPDPMGPQMQSVDQAAMQAHQRMKDRRHCDSNVPCQPITDWAQWEKDHKTVDKLRKRGDRGGQLFRRDDMTG